MDRIVEQVLEQNRGGVDVVGLKCMLEVKGENNPSHRGKFRQVISNLPDGPTTDRVWRQQHPEIRRRQRVRDHVTDMIDSSSFHGFPYIFDKRHRAFRRLFWFLATTAAFSYAMSKVYESVLNFYSYPFHTSRMKRYVEQLTFPAVSFCNQNDMRFSVMNRTKVDKVLLDPTQWEKYNLSGAMYRNITKFSRHNLDDMLVECKFNGHTCTVKNFTEFSWKQGDRCFTINSGKTGHEVLKVEGAGRQRSLELIINIQHYEYYRDGKEAGIHLIIHGQHDTPVKMRGPMIAPGFTTFVAINKKKMINLEPPYKTRCGRVQLKYFKGYSMHTCWLEKLTQYVVKYCQCKDFFMPGNFTVCSLKRAMGCMWIKWEEFEREKKYDCPLPCEIDTYSSDRSRALFPAPGYAKKLTPLMRNISQFQRFSGNLDKEMEFMRNNLLRLVLYYDDLSYDSVEQKPSYDTLALVGDIGGQIGLFMGAGLMSYFEFVDCLLMVFYTQFFEKF